MTSRYVASLETSLIATPVIDSEVDTVNDQYRELYALSETAECRLPLIIEFLGSPKAGKTTVRNMVARVVERNGLRVRAPSEGASLSAKRQLRENLAVFNVSTAMYGLEQIFSYALPRNQCDLLMLDRGIYDARVWFQLLREREIITDQDSSIIQRFFGLPLWRHFVDGIILMTCEPVESERRELLTQIARAGNLGTSPELMLQLLKYYRSDDFLEELQDSRTSILIVDTSSPKSDLRRVGVEVAKWLGHLLRRRLSPGYLTIAKSQLKFSGFLQRDQAPVTDWENSFQFVEKDAAEIDLNRKQCVACAFIQVGEKYLRLRRTGHANRPELQKKSSLVVGGHVEQSDVRDGESLFAILEACVRRELDEELTFDVKPELTFLGFINDESIDAGRFHFAAIFKARFPKGRVAVRPEVSDQEFGARSWGAYERDTIVKESRQFDPWSQIVIEHFLGGPKVSVDKQIFMDFKIP